MDVDRQKNLEAMYAKEVDKKNPLYKKQVAIKTTQAKNRRTLRFQLVDAKTRKTLKDPNDSRSFLDGGGYIELLEHVVVQYGALLVCYHCGKHFCKTHCTLSPDGEHDATDDSLELENTRGGLCLTGVCSCGLEGKYPITRLGDPVWKISQDNR